MGLHSTQVHALAETAYTLLCTAVCIITICCVQGMLRQHTKEDGVELVGSLVGVWQQDAARLLDGQELRLSGLSESSKERIVCLGHALLQSCSVVREGHIALQIDTAP